MNIEKYYTSKDYNLGYEYHHGVGVEKNEKLAFECYQKAADNYDHLLAIFSLGHCYQHGIGVTVNHEMAFEFYKKTFDKGLPEGTYMVGYCYSHGIGVVNNTQESHRFFQMAASHGVTGPFDVGRCFKPDSRRIFTKEKNLELASRYHDSANYIEMFKYFQKSAEMGNAFGTFNVGYSYAKGIGVEKDEHKAFIYYQKSAEMGHANGTYHVGCFYNDGIGVEKDECMAFIYYQKSAEMGHTGGTYNVGWCYQHGEGVEKDERKAFIYYQKSAEMGNASGTINVGDCYRNGIGVEKDEHKAFIYYQKSAEMGDALGTYSVGYCYQNGIGVKKDQHKAFVYFQKTADMGNTEGMIRVGYCYRNGIGVQMNIEKARYWFQKEKDKFHEIVGSEYKDLDIDTELKMLLDNDKYKLAWIPYEFKIVKKIGRGGFATVFSAEREKSIKVDHDKNFIRVIETVALKEFNGDDDWLNEVKAYCEIGVDNPSFMKCHGISRNQEGKYILVLKYASSGSLHDNLDELSKESWNSRLNLLLSICYDLRAIHSNGIVHRDLHSGNILQDDLNSAYIADLGLSIQYMKENDGQVYGILPFVAPEVLEKKAYTIESDIYSFGMIMWEVLYDEPVTNRYDMNDIPSQVLKILDGFRPLVDKVIPRFYADIMERSWSKDLENRPTAKELCEKFKEWSDDETKIRELDECVIEHDHVVISSTNTIHYSQMIFTDNQKDFVIDYDDF